MAAPVEVGIEAAIENQIQEVTLDGQEIYVQPLSMSENLTKLAHKIDFSKDESEEKGKPTSEGDKEDDEIKAITPFQPSLWPWDSVRNKLKQACTEMSVLFDVLNIAKEKRYMVLDPVSQDPPENKAAMHMVSKRKSIGAASTILLNGAERLKKSELEKGSKHRGAPDFHFELLRLRSNWRLKKAGNTIIGDLSYKSTGSRFWQGGTFEVTKKDEEPIDLTESPTTAQPKSALKVTVPSELEGVAYIQVIIKRQSDNTDLSRVDLTLPTDISGTVPSDAHWQRKLEAAQNVIFCKEVFQQLAREAVQVRSQVPHMVVGNQIFSHLFPGIQLVIALCFNTDKDKREVGHLSAQEQGNPLLKACLTGGFKSKQFIKRERETLLLMHQQTTQQKPDHNHVLEHSLHQLLREVHFKNVYHPMPHPVTAVLGMSKRRRLAGPHGYKTDQLIEMTQSETLLGQVIKQSKHIVLQQEAIKVVDNLSQEVVDPQITVHWSNISTADESLIKIAFTSQGYENVRTPLTLYIGIDSIKAVTKDGKVVLLSYEEQELKDFLLCQIAYHQVAVVHQLAKLMSWNVLSINTHVGVGDMEPIGTAMTLLLASPTGDRVMSIRSGAVSGLRVSVQRCPDEKDNAHYSDIVQDEKWLNLGGPFQEIHLSKMEGKNFANKIELLMASLSKPIPAPMPPPPQS